MFSLSLTSQNPNTFSNRRSPFFIQECLRGRVPNISIPLRFKRYACRLTHAHRYAQSCQCLSLSHSQICKFSYLACTYQATFVNASKISPFISFIKLNISSLHQCCSRFDHVYGYLSLVLVL